ncbi:MAG TPA: thioredoxin family protein [Rhodocyclaceae bacterium]|nr:thioredoxin family protein [Rhodocyclaceae bacterium]
MLDLNTEFLVSCLCAQWCGTCREYRPAFDALTGRRPQASYVWVDVEEESDIAGDVEVDNFPTLIIQRHEHVLFCGPMVPDVHALERLLDSFLAQSIVESAAYAIGNAERKSWQGVADVRSRLLAQR